MCLALGTGAGGRCGSGGGPGGDPRARARDPEARRPARPRSRRRRARETTSRLTAVEPRAAFVPIERPSGHARLPIAVVAEVDRRRARVLERARGRVLDLGDAGALEIVFDAARASGADVPSELRYETIVSTCRLVDVADLPTALAGLRRLLADEGELHLVEPVNHPGLASLLVTSAWSVAPTLRDLHLGRDVVRATRAADFAVVDLHRFTVDTPVWPLRH